MALMTLNMLKYNWKEILQTFSQLSEDLLKR